MNLKNCLFSALLIVLFPLHALSANPQVQMTPSGSVNGVAIENALFHYFNDEPEIALVKLEIIETESAGSPIIYEYKARCYWQIAKRLSKIKGADYKEGGEISDLDARALDKLEKEFLGNIDKAIKISRQQFEKNKNSENAYNLVMALSTKSGYLSQMHGKKGALKSAGILDEAVTHIQFCIKNNHPYCLAYLPLGTIQYYINKNITGKKKIGYLIGARFKVPNLYKAVNFDKEEAIEFVEIASRCSGPEFRRTEALFILAEFLMDFEGSPKKRVKNDLRAYSILEELHKTYPNNKKIGEYLQLVQNHLKNKSR